ncbi:MAG: sensor histidine kinase [Nitrospirota bacterium]
MRVPFSQRLATRLFILPLLITLLVIAAGGIGLYFFSPLHLLSDMHRLHLLNLTSEKKMLLDTWFEQSTRSVDYLSRSVQLRSAAAVFRTPPAGEAAKEGISPKAAKALAELFPVAPFRVVAVLSKQGKVIASSQKELEGGDWSDRDFFERAADLKDAAVVGLYDYGNPDSGIIFLAPLADAKGDTAGFLYCLAGLEKVARLLQVESPLYKTGKVELIDREGNIVATKSGAPARKVRYNLPRAADERPLRFKERFFYSLRSLDHAPFRLISTVERSEVMLPFTLLAAFSALCLGALLAVVLVQGLIAAPRRITRPVAKLAGMSKLIAAGTLDIELGKEYRGELQELKKALEAMVEELKAKETSFRESKAPGEIVVRPVWYPSIISHEVRAPLQHMAGELERLTASEQGLSEQGRRLCDEVRDTAYDLLWLINSLLDLLKLEAGGSLVAPEEFNFCDLLGEVEERARRLIGGKEITLVVDCHEVFTSKAVSADRQRLRQILFTLVSAAAKNTAVGTITILSSESIREGISSIEVSIADTGKGLDREVLDRLAGDDSLASLPLSIIIAKRMTELLGGRIEIESEPGKGSAVTVTVPTKAIIY